MVAAGVPLETRKVLLGHKSGDITTHYSAPEIAELLEAANRVAETRVRTLLRVEDDLGIMSVRVGEEWFE